MKTISVISSCFNEEGNLDEFYARVKATLARFPQYRHELIVADNCSTDRSREILRAIAAKDPNFKVIMNSTNFGVVRSPYNALMSATGDAVIALSTDLQEPPEMIAEFVEKWESGALVVCAVKVKSHENPLMFAVRMAYYRLLAGSSENPLIRSFNGFGLYDRKAVEAMRSFAEPYPFFRGLVSEIGFPRVEVPFVQAARKAGRSKNNLLRLYDQAVLGFVNHTKLPLRISVFLGFVLAMLSLGVALAYFIYKILYWDTFSLGLAPVVIGLFFFSSVQLVFIGVIGEYIGAIWTRVKNKPWVVEAERINFDNRPRDLTGSHESGHATEQQNAHEC